MLVETARFWRHLGFYSARRGGKFCIHGVTGPDEYNTVVDNNAYTNLMARENLRYAAETVTTLRERRPDELTELVEHTHLDLAEVEEWQRAADQMYIPYDGGLGITPQDDQFLDHEPWDFAHTPPEKYPLLLFYHPLTIYRHQVIKQPDVVLAMLLLGEEFSPDLKKRNFEFYDPLTTGDSSLSPCIQSIMAAEVGDMADALEYARVGTLMDLGDVAGNVKDGCHIAAMAGVWMIFVYGFAGMRDAGGHLTFRPRLPETMERLRFRLLVRGNCLEVTIGRNATEYRLHAGSGVAIRHEEHEIHLSPATPSFVQPPPSHLG
jgi:alpha,alpha-trehalose phosphorylase